MAKIEIKPRRPREASSLTISASVYTNMLWLANNTTTEVGMVLQAREDNHLYVTGLRVLPQEASLTTFEMNETALEQYMLEYEDTLPLASYYRIWAHTHPSDCPDPSFTDWNNFDEFIRPMPWGVMLIIGKTGRMTANLSVKSLNLTTTIPVDVDYANWGNMLSPEQLEKIVAENITHVQFVHDPALTLGESKPTDEDLWDTVFDEELPLYNHPVYSSLSLKALRERR